MFRILALMIVILGKIKHRLWMKIAKSLFEKCGSNVVFGTGCNFSYDCIIVGQDVYIGPGATFNSAISKIIIGNKVMFGPNVTIMGGDHRTNIIGKFMYDVHEKLPENDKDVVIEDDVWIGANAIILKGVRIGQGSVIGAGSIVTKDVPSYSIYTGVPSVKMRPRWDEEGVALHKKMLDIQ